MSYVFSVLAWPAMRETHKVDSDLRISVQTGDTLEGLSKRFIIPVMPPCFSA
jgi:hypothetical protein